MAVTTFLFTDIEGSTRLWEEDAERMRPALAHHDATAREAVQRHNGRVVKMTGDGLHAAFDDPLDAVRAALDLQHAMAAASNGFALLVRCGIHAGTLSEERDNDFYGTTVNRAARVMGAAHGGQVVMSRVVASMVEGRLAEGITLRALGEVRLKDVAMAEELYQVVDPALRTEFPPPRSLTGVPHNLPQELTSFVGRERETAEVAAMLERSRLVTLTGMGGMGKSRLALKVAAEVMERYPDGVWTVELAGLDDARLVPQAVLSTLKVKEEPGRPLLDALLKHVADRKLLLVLDNCEHLLAGCSDLAKRTLQASPHTTILATSREPLHVTGEIAYAIPGLPTPDPRTTLDEATLGRFESVKLFVERATLARPDFVLGPSNAAAVASICQRLDGVPLALELAAARVRALSVAKLAERLVDRFKVLTAGDATSQPRQQTLRALIDWSYELLTGPERKLLQSLSVFRGGWTLEAAEAVCPSDGEEVLDLLARLVEKSLVVMDPGSDRYRLLETVREYAAEKLVQAGEKNALQMAHLAYMVALIESARSHVFGPEQARWLSRWDDELENFLAAHEHAGNAPEGAELGLRLVNVMRIYWTKRGFLELGERITREALARPGARNRDLRRHRALFGLGWILIFSGRFADAREPLEESLSIARELEDERAVAAVLQPLGMAALGTGDLERAQRSLTEAYELAVKRGDKRELAAASNSLAHLHRMGGRTESAAALYRSVLQLARESGEREMIALALLNMAIVATLQGSNQEARIFVRESLAISQELSSRRLLQCVLEVVAGMGAEDEDWKTVARYIGAADALAQSTGLRRDAADEAFLAPRIALARARLGTSFNEAYAAGGRLSDHELVAEARVCLETPRPLVQSRAPAEEH